MTIVKWDPKGTITTLQDRINTLFEDAFPQRMPGEGAVPGVWSPLVDIFEHEDAVVVHAELPGVDKRNISVDVKQNVLTLCGKREGRGDIQTDSYYRRERRFGVFQRRFTLPHSVDPTRIRATFKDGVLEIRIPKPDAHQPRQLKVDID
jgi:HSP20 family protein